MIYIQATIFVLLVDFRVADHKT